MEELLSLKWNNHKTSFLDVLARLRVTDQYSDVTLACEGRLFSAHKIVLSTCSEYFYTIFEQMTDKNLVIVLKDIRCEDLEALLDYMYLGEVNVKQSDLASLIKVAECLKLRGLAVPDSTSRADATPTSKRPSDTSIRPRKKKKLSHTTELSSNPESESFIPDIKVDDDPSNNNLTDVKKEMEDIVIEEFQCDASLTEQNDDLSYNEHISDTHKIEPYTEDSQPGTSFQSDSGLWKDEQSVGNKDFVPFSYPDEEFDTSHGPDDQPMDEQGIPIIVLETTPTPITNLDSIQQAEPTPITNWDSSHVQQVEPTPLINVDSSREPQVETIRSRVCHICLKSFFSVYKCKRHMTVHTKEKHFKCPFCSHQTNRRDNLKIHVFNVHSDIRKSNPHYFYDKMA